MRTIKGRYTLEREIGRGATGAVWVALDGRLGRRVAVKLLRSENADSHTARSRFEQEAWAIAQLRSPHVVQVHDVGVHDDEPYIVMELLEGESLDARLERHSRLSLAVVADIVTQVARALAVTHEAGILHRDLKPANIFLAREQNREVVKLLDFSVAVLTGRVDVNGAALPVPSGLQGTPKYMSPEQLSVVEADHRADLWSLAVLTYRMLTGRLPFEADNLLRLRALICAAAFEPASSIVAELGPSIDAFMQRALAREPADRFPTASDFSSELLEVARPRSSAVHRVLILDDEPDMELLVRQRFRRQLRDGTYELYFAHDGQEGLDELRRRPDINVVLTDLNMPGMDGLTFLSRVPEVNPLVRVVVVSAYGDMSNIRSAMNHGAFDFLGKPVDFDDLQRTIAKCSSHVTTLRSALHAQEENGILRTLVGQRMADRLVAAVRAVETIRHESIDACVVFMGHCGCDEVLQREAPDVVFRHFNDHFDFLVPEISARGGTVTRFVGPIAMAVFDGTDHLSRALDACLEIREWMRTHDTGRAPRSSETCGVAFGLDAGTIMTGGIGSVTLGRLEHVYIGDPVTTAAQLFAAARKGEVLVSARLGASLAARYVCEPDPGRRVTTHRETLGVSHVRRRASRVPPPDEAGPTSCGPTMAPFSQDRIVRPAGS
ncbi:MAG TPA: protein kinase [Polyangiaceae bacterium]|jgi:serine/threonine protein kinase/class 3 adenylate cyclase|nr:protein kinase [Polyangiaceae bacterium]